MGSEKFHLMDGCSCNRPRPMNAVHCLSSLFLVVLLGIVSFPCGSTAPHLSSVLEDDDVPGIPMKVIHRGPTVAPVPSPETLKQLELLSRRDGGDHEGYFNAAEAIRNLLSRSSSSHRGGQGLKRVSQFHGNGEAGLLGIGSYHIPSIPAAWEYDENGMNGVDEDGQPTFVPYIGARALTNIPQFFEHLKENIEALKLSPPMDEDGDGDGGNDGSHDDNDNNGEVDDDDLYSNFEERPPKKDKPAARRMKTELLVDENMEDPSKLSDSSSSKQNWKPRAAGIIHYYSPKSNFLHPQQSILRRANNYNPSWLYTNLGLGKKRRR